jgi:hypothetical protein
MDHLCDNCGKIVLNEELNDVKNLAQRITPGGIVPSGECPHCEALCYPITHRHNPVPTTFEEHIRFICAHLADVKTGLKEVALELRKKNRNEEARLRFNQKKQRLEALNFLKEGGLVELLPELKGKFEASQKAKETPEESAPSEQEKGESTDVDTEAGGS